MVKWNRLNDFKDARTEKGSSQGQILALTVLLVPNLLADGRHGAGGALVADRQCRDVFQRNPLVKGSRSRA